MVSLKVIGGLLQNPWLGIGYIPVGLGTFVSMEKYEYCESKKLGGREYFPNRNRTNEKPN